MFRDKLLFFCYIASLGINTVVVSILGYSHIMSAAATPLPNPEAALHPVRLGVYKPPAPPVVKPTVPKPSAAPTHPGAKHHLAAGSQAAAAGEPKAGSETAGERLQRLAAQAAAAGQTRGRGASKAGASGSHQAGAGRMAEASGATDAAAGGSGAGHGNSGHGDASGSEAAGASGAGAAGATVGGQHSGGGHKADAGSEAGTRLAESAGGHRTAGASNPAGGANSTGVTDSQNQDSNSANHSEGAAGKAGAASASGLRSPTSPVHASGKSAGTRRLALNAAAKANPSAPHRSATANPQGKAPEANAKAELQPANKAANKSQEVRLASNEPSDKSKDEAGTDEPAGGAKTDNTKQSQPEPDKKDPAKPQSSRYIMPKVAKMWTVRPNQKIVLPKDLKLNMPANMPIVPGVKPLTAEQIEELRKLLHQQNLKQIKGLSREQLKKFLQARKDTERPKAPAAGRSAASDANKKAAPRQAARPRPKPRLAGEQPEGGAALPAGLTSPFKYKPWSPAWQRYAQVVKKTNEDRVLLAQGDTPPRQPETNSNQNRQGGQTPTGQPNAPQTNNSQANPPANNGGGNVASTPPVGGNQTTPEAQAGGANDQHTILGTGQANGQPVPVPAPTSPSSLANNAGGGQPVGNPAVGGQATSGQPGNNQQNGLLGSGQVTPPTAGQASNPGAGQANAQPDGAQAGTGQTGGQTPGGQTGAGQPDNGQPNSGQAANNPGALLGTGQGTGQPDNGQPGATQPGGAPGQSNAGNQNGQPGQGQTATQGAGQNNQPGALLGTGQGQPTQPGGQANGQLGTGQLGAGQPATGQQGAGQQGTGQGGAPNNQGGPQGNQNNQQGGLLGSGQGAPQGDAGQPGAGQTAGGQTGSGQPAGGQAGANAPNGKTAGGGQGNAPGALLGGGQTGGQPNASQPNGGQAGGQPGGPQNGNQPRGQQNTGQQGGILGAGQGSPQAGNQPGAGQGGLLGSGQAVTPPAGQNGAGQTGNGQQPGGQAGNQAGGLLGGGQGQPPNGTAAGAQGNNPQGGQGTAAGGLLGGGQAGTPPAGQAGQPGGQQGPQGAGGLLGGGQGGPPGAPQGGQPGDTPAGGQAGAINALMAQGDGGLEGGGFVDSEGVGGEGDANSDTAGGGEGNQSDTGFTPAVGVEPHMPEHNHDLQNGLPGALVLPPLPPIGTEAGKELEPREVKPSTHAATVVIPALQPAPPAVRPTTHTSASVARRTTTETSVKGGTPAKPRRLAMTPGSKPKPRQAEPPIVALSVGSTSDQGTIPVDIMKRPGVPLGTATDMVNPLLAPETATRNAPPTPGALRPQPRGGVPATEEKGAAGQKNAGKRAAPVAKPAVDRRAATQHAIAQFLDESQTPDRRVVVKTAKDKQARNSRGIKEGSKNPLPPMPLPDSDAEIGDGSGLKGEYYLGRNFDQYEFTRADANLDNFWGDGQSPSPRLPAGADWSCRWTGKIEPRYSETYTIYAVADDGVRVWINHKLIIDDWTLHAMLEYPGQIKLEAGKQYDIRVDYFESGGPPASIGIYWESPSQKKEFIPEDRLFYPLAGDKEEMSKDEIPHH